ncbi:PKD domain-containing protein [uncultured Methanospirillum sp.]|uniref:PKD domain-containing protein n=1 Tax=uncultured Methanospirillum sp. TaxID=262503 RepID=UPI0037484B59
MSDNYTWLLYKGSNKYVDQFSTTDNYTTFTFDTPEVYRLYYNATNYTYVPCVNSKYVVINALFPINGSINQTGPTVNWQAAFKYNLSDNSSLPNTLDWNFGDGNVTNGVGYPVTIPHRFPYSSPTTTKTYPVSVTAKNSTPSIFSDNYTTLAVTVYPPPVSNFTITDNFTGNVITQGPAPVKANLNFGSWTFDTYSGSGLISRWNISNSSGFELNSSDNFTHIFNNPGIYTIEQNTSTEYGSNLSSKVLLVYDNITSNFTPVQYRCAAFPANVTFRDNSTGSNRDKFTWTYDDGTQDVNLTTNWTNHTYYQPGRYNLTMWAWNNTFGIWNQSSQFVNITGLYANFTADPWTRTINRGDAAVFNFSDNSTGTDLDTIYTWELEPGIKEHKTGVSYQYFRNGTYNVSLTVSNPVCGVSNTSVKQVTVYEHLNANMTYSPKCGTFPLNVTFSDNSTDTPFVWLWKFYDLNGNRVAPDGEGRTVTHQYASEGTYLVQMTAMNAQHENVNDKEFYITLDYCLQANFTANQTRGYYPFTVNFTDTSTPQSSVNTRTWNFADQTSGSGASEIHTFNQKGTYNVSLTVTNTSSGMTRVANKTIEVGSPVFANFTPNGTSVVPVNASMVVKFSDLSAPQSDITNWDWNFDDSLPNDTNKSPYHQFTSEGWHNVTLNVSNPYYGAWNVSRARINVSVQKAPEASFTVTPEVANRFERVTFVDTSKGESINGWYWQFGDGNTSTGTPVVNYYQNAGTYVVNLTVTNPYGNGTASNTVRIKGPVYADFVTDPSGEWGVINQPITFIDTSKGQPIHWIWNFGDGNSTTTDTSSITHTYTSTGSYTVNMTGTNWDGQSGSAVKTLQIENKSKPKDVNFGAAGKRYSGTHPFTVQFEDYTPNQSNVTEWYWDFGDRSNSFNTTPVAPSHTYVNPGEYTVILSVKNDMGVNEKTRVAYVVVV